MNNLVINRIQSQTANAPTLILPEGFVTVSLPVILPKDLQKLLEDTIKEPLKLEIKPEEHQFNNIYDFVSWYVSNQSVFTSMQQIPLNTLIQARQIIDQGCNCRRKQREEAANNYFKDFWEKNKLTDIIPTILKALNVKRITFGNFLIFP